MSLASLFTRFEASDKSLFMITASSFMLLIASSFKSESFLSIENLCFVIKELLENNAIPSGIYQVADDASLSTNELIELLGTSLNKKSRIFNIPSSWIKRGAKLGDYLHLPLNSERLQKLTENYVVSNHKILTAMEKGLPVSTEQGLIRTFESFRE